MSYPFEYVVTDENGNEETFIVSDTDAFDDASADEIIEEAYADDDVSIVPL